MKHLGLSFTIFLAVMIIACENGFRFLGSMKQKLEIPAGYHNQYSGNYLLHPDFSMKAYVIPTLLLNMVILYSNAEGNERKIIYWVLFQFYFVI